GEEIKRSQQATRLFEITKALLQKLLDAGSRRRVSALARGVLRRLQRLGLLTILVRLAWLGVVRWASLAVARVSARTV
ncbi:MAG: hypothetical protein JXR94_21495, partial [Candidatus Hydrogenedentes bacterium]|nr:hypothetical protein [Candidatus Hydrogenedentota bacterium]